VRGIRCLGLLLAASLPAVASAGGFAITFQGQRVDYTTSAVFALPNEAVDFDIESGNGRAPLVLTTDFGEVRQLDAQRWRWSAPAEAGAFGTLYVAATGDSPPVAVVNAFILVPAEEATDGYVGAFRVDPYPTGAPAKSTVDYAPPAGFVRVTEANRHLHVSPHFLLGQFVSKQQGDWPKYVVPGLRLYAKLERVLDAVRAAGFPADTLHVMSGYRTPYYNRAIGNVQFSRHIYGDAADVFVDIDEDGNMDDLNGDGTVNVRDAVTMADWLEALSGEPSFAPLRGGLGIYDSNPYHGPFIHVDARGSEARWGVRPH
jgi:hypothetical protein